MFPEYLSENFWKMYIPGNLGTKDYRDRTPFRNSHLYFIFLFKKKSLKHMKFTGKLKYNAKFAAAAAKSLQSCPTLHDPMDCSLPDSSVHGIFQARVLEWVAIAFSNKFASW